MRPADSLYPLFVQRSDVIGSDRFQVIQEIAQSAIVELNLHEQAKNPKAEKSFIWGGHVT